MSGSDNLDDNGWAPGENTQKHIRIKVEGETTRLEHAVKKWKLIGVLVGAGFAAAGYLFHNFVTPKDLDTVKESTALAHQRITSVKQHMDEFDRNTQKDISEIKIEAAKQSGTLNEMSENVRYIRAKFDTASITTSERRRTR